MYLINRWGQLYLSRDSKEYKIVIREWVRRYMVENHIKPLVADNIIMRMMIAWGSHREQDPANLDKLLPDTLQGVAWEGSDAKLYIQHVPPAIIDTESPRVFVILSEDSTPMSKIPSLPDDLADWHRQMKDKHREALQRKRDRKRTKKNTQSKEKD